MTLEENEVFNAVFPPLTPSQQMVADFDARFYCCCTGRRWGKTLLAGTKAANAANKGGQVWWLAPAIKTLNAGLDTMKRLCDPLKPYGVRFRNSSAKIPTFYFPSGGKIEFHTANDPNTLRGSSLDFFIFDEAAYIHPDAWNYVVSLMVADRAGGGMFFSTPKGRNWYYDLYKNARYSIESDGTGLQNLDIKENRHGLADWAAFKFTSYDNPTIPKEEFDRLVLTLPHDVAQQEIYAAFMEDASTVFRGVREAAIWPVEKAQAGHVYVLSVDLAKTQDFTVIIVFDLTTMRQVYMERFQDVEYPVQVECIGRVYDQYRPIGTYVEINQNGDSVIDYLKRDGIPAQGVVTSASTKGLMIKSYALAIENGGLGLLNDHELIEEHLSYEMEITDSGHVRYGAPNGKHDDCVMAGAIGWYGVTQALIRKPIQIARGSLPIYGKDNSPRRQYAGYSKLKESNFGRRR